LGAVDQSDPELWKRTVEVNLVGTYHSARAAIPYLKARGAGKIIVVGSGQGHQSSASTSAYACSKAGTWALVQSLAAELVSFNISVNELLPGNVKTKLYDDTFQQVVAMTPKGSASLAEKRSSEWLKAPEDVIPLALFMACQPDVGPTAQSFSLMRRF
jgi:3-oxoacyl-[acyl-carrier protein] reductase